MEPASSGKQESTSTTTTTTAQTTTAQTTTPKPEPTQKKNKVFKDISNEIVLNFKFDDFDPSNQKYHPTYFKYHDQISFESVSIFDQNRYRFILSNSFEPSNNNLYEKGNYSTINWSSIVFVIYYFAGLYQCPICLESEIICPQITECGHVFCWPCLVNFSNYSTAVANKNNNTKLPQCPICSKKLDLAHYEGKFCEIIQCFDYSVNEKNEITFDLIMRNKNSSTLYNINSDPDLSYWKKKGMKEMMSIPFETDSFFSFSRVFYSAANHMLERLIKYKEILELELKEEKGFYADERRIESLNECIKVVNKMILKAEKDVIKDKELDGLNDNKDKDNPSKGEIVIKSDENSLKNEPSINYSKFYLLYQENYGDIYYLHPLLFEMIQMEYSNEGQYPSSITGNILDIEMHQVTYNFKKNYPYLAHLRIGSIIFFVEIEMKHLVSFNTYKAFGNELRKRAKIRMMLTKEEKSYEKFIKTKMIQEDQSHHQITTQLIPPLKDKKDKEQIENIKETHYIPEEDEDNIKESINETKEPNAQSETKKANKLHDLLNKAEILAKQREEEEEQKKFHYKEEDFPTLSADLFLSKAASNKKAGGGRKNKKKKFTEIAPDLLMQIENNLTLNEIEKENTAKQKKISTTTKGGISNDNKGSKKQK